MLEELRRYNTIGDIAGISYFTSIVLSGEKIQKSALQKLCDLQNNIRLNLKAAITYYKYMDLIVEKESWLYVTENGKKISKTTDFENDFCRLCIDKIIRDGLLDMEAVRYSRVTNTYYIERFGFSVSAALFRNILIQYKALSECSGNLQINPKYEILFGDLQKKTRMKKSLEKLKLQLEQQERQGELAELFVLEYEKKRITNAILNEKIKRISIIDVAAGYDIVSYNNDEAIEHDRFIEVKSYVGSPHFYWSNNEIETAKLYGNKYYIYLIDASKMTDEKYVPDIICNPAEEIIASEKWIMNPTSFIVMPTE